MYSPLIQPLLKHGIHLVGKSSIYSVYAVHDLFRPHIKVFFFAVGPSTRKNRSSVVLLKESMSRISYTYTYSLIVSQIYLCVQFSNFLLEALCFPSWTER